MVEMTRRNGSGMLASFSFLPSNQSVTFPPRKRQQGSRTKSRQALNPEFPSLLIHLADLCPQLPYQRNKESDNRLPGSQYSSRWFVP